MEAENPTTAAPSAASAPNSDTDVPMTRPQATSEEAIQPPASPTTATDAPGPAKPKYNPVRVNGKLVVPEGMTKSAYKRLLRKQRFEESKAQWAKEKRERRKKLKADRKKQLAEEKQKLLEQGIDPDTVIPPAEERPPPINLPVKVIIDCGFDDLMSDKERVSLSVQIVRSYSENKRGKYAVDLHVTSFNKLLYERFTVGLRNQHLKWKHITFSPEDFLGSVPEEPEERAKWVYLSSDSDNVIETLESGFTYVIGGIVDKGRYKNLCKNKAEAAGIKTGRLPIDKYISIAGRRVLTTNHVFEILLQWFSTKDWKQAFENVLPPRKLLENSSQSGAGSGSEDESGESDSAETVTAGKVTEEKKQVEGSAESTEKPAEV